MPVLGPTYRLNLLDMLNDDGTRLEDHSTVVNGNWGVNFSPTTLYLTSAAVASPDTPLASGTIPFVMPANYIAGSGFTVRLGVVNNSNNAPLEGSVVTVSIKKIPADSYDDAATTIFSGSEDMTVGVYTEYDFEVSSGDAASLNPGDFVNMKLGCAMNPAADDSDYVFLSSAFVRL